MLKVGKRILYYVCRFDNLDEILKFFEKYELFNLILEERI